MMIATISLTVVKEASTTTESSSHGLQSSMLVSHESSVGSHPVRSEKLNLNF